MEYDKVVEQELEAYFYGIISSGVVESDIQLLNTARAVTGAVPENKIRLWQVDCGLHEELHDKLSRSNPFFSARCGAIPPISDEQTISWRDLLDYFFRGNENNVLCWSSHGIAQNEKQLGKITKKLGLTEHVPMLVVPDTLDLKTRKLFTYSAEPRPKKMKVGSMSSLMTERLDFYMKEGFDVEDLPRKWLPGPQPYSLAFPLLQDAPLLQPDALLRVSLETKNAIMKSPSTQGLRSSSNNLAATQVQVAPETEGDKIILFHQDRSPKTCAELDHIWKVHYKVLLTVGNGTAIKGSIMEKCRVVALFRNKAHLDIVRADIKEWLGIRVRDPNDVRFYRKATPAPEQCADKAEDEHDHLGAESFLEAPSPPNSPGSRTVAGSIASGVGGPAML